MDAPFERGKCGYKLIQYMACAVPVIASPVGVNTQIVTPDVTGYLAASIDDWVTALQTLRADDALAMRIGANGRALVEAKYSTRNRRQTDSKRSCARRRARDAPQRLWLRPRS